MNDDHQDPDDRRDRSDADPFDAVARRAVVALVDRPVDRPSWSAIEDAATHQHRAHNRRRVLVVATVAVVLMGVIGAGLVRARDVPVVYRSGAAGDVPTPEAEELQRSDDLPEPRIEALPESPFGSRDDASAVWTGSELIVWGGSDATVHADGAALDRATGRWRTIAASPLSPRTRHTAVWTGSEMVIWGGTPERSGVGRLLDGAAYDPVSDSWRRIADAPAGTDRSSAKRVMAGGQLVIGGGSAPTAPMPPVLVYDLATDRWASVDVGGETASVTTVGPLVVAVTMDRFRDGPPHLVGVDPTRASVAWRAPVPQPVRSRVAWTTITTDRGEVVVLVGSTVEGASGPTDQTVAWFDPSSRSFTRVLHGDHVMDASLFGQPQAAGMYPFVASRSRLQLFTSPGLTTIDPAVPSARTWQTHRRFCASSSMASAVDGDEILVWGGQGTCSGNVSYVGTGATIRFG